MNACLSLRRSEEGCRAGWDSHISCFWLRLCWWGRFFWVLICVVFLKLLPRLDGVPVCSRFSSLHFSFANLQPVRPSLGHLPRPFFPTLCERVPIYTRDILTTVRKSCSPATSTSPLRKLTISTSPPAVTHTLHDPNSRFNPSFSPLPLLPTLFFHSILSRVSPTHPYSFFLTRIPSPHFWALATITPTPSFS